MLAMDVFPLNGGSEKDFWSDLQERGIAGLNHAGETVTIAMVAMPDGPRMIVAMPKACVYLNPSTPFNQWELVKGGFRIDVATSLIAYLHAAREANTVSPIEGHNADRLAITKQE